MTVYQVKMQPQDNVYLVGIFSTRKKAEDTIKKIHNETGVSTGCFTTEPIKINKVLI